LHDGDLDIVFEAAVRAAILVHVTPGLPYPLGIGGRGFGFDKLDEGYNILE